MGTVVVFQSTRPVWGATLALRGTRQISRYFNPRAPCGARQSLLYKYPLHEGISIHAPRVGRDLQCFRRKVRQVQFQSTRPVWGATNMAMAGADLSVFQSTRPVWGATNAMISKGITAKISIHAPRVGRDGDCVRSTLDRTRISIHAPRVGRDIAGWFFLLNPEPISIHAPRVGRDHNTSLFSS